MRQNCGILRATSRKTLNHDLLGETYGREIPLFCLILHVLLCGFSGHRERWIALDAGRLHKENLPGPIERHLVCSVVETSHKRVSHRGKTMAIPTVDQTEGIWIDRTSNEGNHYIQEIFSRESHSDQAHRSNCSKLIYRGSLQPEDVDHLLPTQREWDQKKRYHRVHQ